jgi:protein-S-isoprenylcysteine O-methyltransferase Ste14
MFAALVVVRPVPLRRGSNVSGILAALGAQAGVLVLGVVAGDSGSGLVLAVSNVVLAAGLVFAIASLAFLGRCFGVLPDVRGLVTRGPYRLVRHPLYLGELTAVLGVAMGSDHWQFALPVWCLVVGLQLIRTHYEERTLRAEFPEYGPYAQRTKRLIPGLV